MIIKMHLEPFLINAVLAGVAVAVITGVMGCFVVWRRMAYFGDSLAHSALLGVALGFAVGVAVNLGIIIICSIFAVLLLWLQRKKVLATDTLLGILAHSALSIGMVTISIMGQRIDLHSILFGDILTVTRSELWWIYIGGIIVMIMLVTNWSSLVLMTLQEDLAQAEGVRVLFCNLLLMFLMTLVVAVSIRSVGILLISSLLIIPAATARQLAKSPEGMAILASVFGVASVGFGIYFSFELDTPSGPTIVAAAASLFTLLTIYLQGIKKK
jgi:zinc transport system permease protein